MIFKYRDIMDAFDFVNFGGLCEPEAYLNIHTGKIFFYSDFVDSEYELPQDIDDASTYIVLPHKIDLDLGKNLVLKFTSHHMPEELETIESIFRNKGAYSKFKHILESKDMLDKWYQYEKKAGEEALQEWCKVNEIEISDK
jgi:Uncharacterised protein family (UPF0158)